MQQGRKARHDLAVAFMREAAASSACRFLYCKLASGSLARYILNAVSSQNIDVQHLQVMTMRHTLLGSILNWLTSLFGLLDLVFSLAQTCTGGNLLNLASFDHAVSHAEAAVPLQYTAACVQAEASRMHTRLLTLQADRTAICSVCLQCRRGDTT